MVHILAAVVAGFIAFPLAIIAKKGSRLHVLAGRAYVIGFLGICATGYALEYDEVMKSLLLREQGVIIDSHIINSHIVITGAVNTFAAYLVVSAWRIANKHRSGPRPLFDKIFDITIALILIFVIAIFFYAAFDVILYKKHFMHIDTKENYSALFVILWVVVIGGLIEATLDIFRATGLWTPERWWITHMRKMLLSALGLLLAFIYRCYHP
ncbi:MAG: hypothetical protein NTY13_01030 [Chlamydiae bacterium]|nr:hypothetical protein [Chlamydiota bacterium]